MKYRFSESQIVWSPMIVWMSFQLFEVFPVYGLAELTIETRCASPTWVNR